MFIEGSELPDNVVVESEICIIGAGAAGITMALELSGSPFRVSIIEAGGFDYPGDGQEAYQGSQDGIQYADLDTSRLRYFGGTTNHWGGYCRPLEPIDFEQRDWVPHSGWPIRVDDITPYYGRAAEIIGINPKLFDGDHWTAASDMPSLPFDSSKFRTAATVMNPNHFGETYRENIRQSSNVSCYVNCSVTDIVIGEHESVVSEVSVINAAGTRSTFRAKQFVLACGGLENPRILLNANKVRPAGIGNDNDNVGRYFMDHRVTYPGMILLSDPKIKLDYYRLNRLASGDLFEGSLHLSEEAARSEKICGAQFSMEHSATVRSQGDVSLTKLREGMSRFISGGSWMPNFTDHVANVFRDIDHVASNLSRRITGAKTDKSLWLLKMEAEQTPNPDSRVTLTDERDARGTRRINLHWATSEIEKHTVRRSLELMGEELGRLGIGRIKIDMADDPNVWSRFDNYGFHHAGTTRMSLDPKDGVVDGNCQVHGIGNLHVVGNSVFTTVGTANPTFTITALSIRLAAHLKDVLSA
jgi:choline dehydrogenase-like flavoprotein